MSTEINKNLKIMKTFKTLSAALEYANKNSTFDNKNILQIVYAPNTHFYRVDDKGYCNVVEVIICTLNEGKFFKNGGLDNVKMQLWINSLQTSEISNMCFETYGRSDWGNITDDQMAYLYAKT